MFEERIEVFVEEEGNGLIIGMFFIPRGASPESRLKNTEGVFGKSGQIRPLWICLDRGSKCNTLRVGVCREVLFV